MRYFVVPTSPTAQIPDPDRGGFIPIAGIALSMSSRLADYIARGDVTATPIGDVVVPSVPALDPALDTLPVLHGTQPRPTSLGELESFYARTGGVLRTLIDEKATQADIQAAVAAVTGGAGGTVISGTAAVVTGGHKVLYALSDDARLTVASASQVAQAGKVVGVSVSAALANKPISYVTAGLIDEPTWSFVPGPVWLGELGGLVQVPPSSGFVQVVGIAVTATRILVSIQPPFILVA